MPTRIVTAYTPEYDSLAARLVMSADRLNIPITAVPFASRGSWQANHLIKPEAILQVIQETGDDCLWLDADMYLRHWPATWMAGDVLLKYSDPPEAQVFDFAQGRIVSNATAELTPWGGHMLFRDSSMVRALLALWQRTCAQYAGITNDEQCLRYALGLISCKITVSPFPDPAVWIVHNPQGIRNGKPVDWL